MGRDISTYTVEEVVSALYDPEHHDACKAALLKTEALPEELLGLRDLMEQHNWNTQALNALLSPAPDLFEQLQNRNRQNRMGFWPLKVAAVLVPLLGISWFIRQQNNTTTANLYATYYVAEPGLPVTMSVSTNVAFANAMSAFKDNQWQEAEHGFTLLLNQQSSNDTLHYYMGCVQLEKQLPSDAITHFSSIDTKSTFYRKARYRMLLAHLSLGNTELARSLAIAIANDTLDNHSEKAALLLSESVFSDE
jgi:TolA-binding protein